MVSMYLTFMTQKNAILQFQESFGYNEEIWSYDSIKKDFFRNGPNHRINLMEEITIKSEHIILGNLSDLGTISHKLVKNHDRNKQKA